MPTSLSANQIDIIHVALKVYSKAELNDNFFGYCFEKSLFKYMECILRT